MRPFEFYTGVAVIISGMSGLNIPCNTAAPGPFKTLKEVR